MTENMLLAKHQQISKNIKIDYNNIRELLYEKVKNRADEIFCNFVFLKIVKECSFT